MPPKPIAPNAMAGAMTMTAAAAAGAGLAKRLKSARCMAAILLAR
jgi:hypothetical protein